MTRNYFIDTMTVALINAIYTLKTYETMFNQF